MRRSILRLWLGAGMLAGIVAGGCRQVEPPCRPCGHTQVACAENGGAVTLRIETVPARPGATLRPGHDRPAKTPGMPSIGNRPSVPMLPPPTPGTAALAPAMLPSIVQRGDVAPYLASGPTGSGSTSSEPPTPVDFQSAEQPGPSLPSAGPELPDPVRIAVAPVTVVRPSGAPDNPVRIGGPPAPTAARISAAPSLPAATVVPATPVPSVLAALPNLTPPPPLPATPAQPTAAAVAALPPLTLSPTAARAPAPSSPTVIQAPALTPPPSMPRIPASPPAPAASPIPVAPPPPDRSSPALAPTSHREVQTALAPASPGSERRLPYAHQSSYLWLTGVLEPGQEPGTWSLRYARPEDNDTHGGVLPLVAPQPIAGYRAGQVLRVEGHIIMDSASTSYQVERIEVMPQY